MGNDSQNGWNEYSRLVLKELETLTDGITALGSLVVPSDTEREYYLQAGRLNTAHFGVFETDDYRIYDTALTPTQISTIHNSGNGDIKYVIP